MFDVHEFVNKVCIVCATLADKSTNNIDRMSFSTQTNHMCTHIKTETRAHCVVISICRNQMLRFAWITLFRCVGMISMTLVWLSTNHVHCTSTLFNGVLWRFSQIAIPRMNQRIKRRSRRQNSNYHNELISFVLICFLFDCRLCSIGALHWFKWFLRVQWSFNWLRDFFLKSFLARLQFSRHIFPIMKYKDELHSKHSIESQTHSSNAYQCYTEEFL